MRRFAAIWISIALFGTALVAVAQRPTIKPTPPVTPAPMVGPWANKFFLPNIGTDPSQVAPPVLIHDFGVVPYGTLSTQKFTVTNIYEVPIQVIDVRVECGCLKAYPPNKVLQPNEQAEFAVTMNAGVFKGPNAKTMYVTFGPNFVSTAVLRLSANSREDVSLTPGEIDFGIVSQGSKATKTAVLKYTGRQRDWKLTAPVGTSAAFDVEVKESSRGPLLGVDYWVTVNLKSDAPAGSVNEAIAIKTNDPAVPVVNVNVRAAILAPVTLAPEKLEFKNVKVGEIATFKVIVRTSDDKCLLTTVPEDADGFSLETSPMASRQHVVTVKFEPKKAGVFRKELKLATNLPGSPSAVITVDATAQ